MKCHFYVYEHWRPDTGKCFYVGKGHGRRANELRRRKGHHAHIVKKLFREGMAVEVRIFAGGLSERDALDLEIVRIAHWRDLGVELANITDGGDGVSGLVHSDKTRKLLSEKRAGVKTGPCREETKRKIADAHRGKLRGKNPEHSARMKGRKWPADVIAKRSASLCGRTVSEETREKIRRSNLGQKRTEATRAALRASHLGNRPTDETRRKQSESMRMAWVNARPERRIMADQVKKKLSDSRKETWKTQVLSEETRAKLRDAANRRWAKERSVP